ncbi:MATE family efflux transporter [Uliginosibacterium sp. H3]|uniref:Multidrug-efflux transporter n=1 Tax=Uliginosibacterium silvisoli TaxID=3114758 RepID=A0ABU6K643_9RHOO|nr:MATE family efflux transporter [Uliginosibacterium sp. H3]
MTTSTPSLKSRFVLRALLAHASPILIAQLASMSTTIVDTVIAGYAGTVDLAAVGIGSGIYISVMLAFAGIVQGLTPIAAQHFGARRISELPASFQQGIWLAAGLALLGMVLMIFPGWLLNASSMTPEIEARTRAYLTALAFVLPGTLIYRTCGGMLNAIGAPRMLMFFGLANAGVHALLAPTLAFGWLGTTPLGAVGCAISNVIITSSLAIAGLVYLARSQRSQALHLLSGWQAPSLARIGEILRIGLPIGMSAFVEITSFALIALMVAPLGPIAVGGHRILGSFGGVCYMLPLSISIATLAMVGQAAGAQDWPHVRKTVRVGMLLGVGASTSLALLLWASGDALIRVYTPDPAVQQLAISLIGLIAFYQLFDAVQTVAAQALRGLKQSIGPMTIHIICFWGVGMAGGWWLCYRGFTPLGIAPMGLGGFWWAATLATIVASAMFAALLRASLQKTKTTQITSRATSEA